MSFLDKYNKTINYFLDHILKEELINSFVSFYGKNYERKIRNVINNLVMLRVQPNLGNARFDKETKFNLNKLKEHSRVVFDYLGVSYQENNVLVAIEELIGVDYDIIRKLIKEKDFDEQIFETEFKSLKLYWYKYQYHNELKNMYLDQKLFITGRNVETNQYDSLINKMSDEVCDGAAFMDVDDSFLIVLFGYGIDLSVLIHEINHLLSRELLLDLGNGRFKKQDGFCNSGDLFYETINDYMSMYIFQNLNSRLGHEFDFILKRDKYYSGYLEVDEVYRYPVRSIYYMARELIKESLINGNGNKFVKVIGKKNYAKIVMLLQECYLSIVSQLMIKPYLKMEEVVLDNEKINLFDEYLSDIYNQLFEYVDYNENLERQLSALEKQGTIRRL